MNYNYMFLREGNSSVKSIVEMSYKGMYRLKEYPVIIEVQYPIKALYKLYGKQ